MPSLAIARVTAPDSTPERWITFLHGILGSGSNWRTFARQLVQARPAWGALLVDLRLHGDSKGFAPPHTLEAAARDVVEVIAGLPGEAHAVLGHSFGGKVGIAVARELDASRPLEHLFVIDSTPGARPDGRGSSGVRHIVELLADLPDELPDRNAFTAWVEARGVSRPIAMWLAMNVRPITGTSRFAFRIDVPAVRAMMNDYFAHDLWDVIERPPRGRRTHIIVGGQSEVLDTADLERARRCPQATVDVFPEAGHWVHVDAPDQLLAVVQTYLD
jgi:pimeloyl-ACP methyl ester carboxylesterase